MAHGPARSDMRVIEYADHIALVAEAMVFLDIDVPDLSEEDADAVRRAFDAIGEMPRSDDWRHARDLRLARVDHHSALGVMAPPRSAHKAGKGLAVIEGEKE